MVRKFSIGLLVLYVAYQHYLISGYEEMNTMLQDTIVRNMAITDYWCKIR